MKVTFILKNLTDAFFDGMGEQIKGLSNMDNKEKFQYLNKIRLQMCDNVKMKIGTGQFRDAVDLNAIVRKETATYEYKIEPRKGYKLVTFDIK